MNFWQRALKNVSRKKTKSLLLLITFFVIGNFVIVGLGISSAANTAKVLTRKKMRAVVTYGIDYNKVSEYVMSLEDIDAEEEFYRHRYPRIAISDVQEVLKDERVKTANALSLSSAYTADKFTHVVLNNKASENESENSGREFCVTNEDGSIICQSFQTPTLSLKGNYFPDMIEFADDTYTLLEGRFYTQEEINNRAKVVVISKALAEANGIGVGDHFSYLIASKGELKENGPLAGLKEEDILIDSEVIGIYDMKQKATPDTPGYEWMGASENPENVILLPASTLEDSLFLLASKRFENMAKSNIDDYYSDPENAPKREQFNSLGDVTLLLNDPLQVDNFVAEYEGKVEEFKKISANNDEFNRLSKPLDTLSLYANFIVWLVVLNAIIIITLVTALTLKTREFEIGVLLSIGASKFKVIMQFFVELAVVAVLGFTLAVASGSLMANHIGKTVLDYQITTNNIKEDDNNSQFYTSFYESNYDTNLSLDDVVSEYNVSVSPMIIAQIYVVGLGIVLISTLIPSMMIMRFNPKKILMNQG